MPAGAFAFSAGALVNPDLALCLAMVQAGQFVNWQRLYANGEDFAGNAGPEAYETYTFGYLPRLNSCGSHLIAQEDTGIIGYFALDNHEVLTYQNMSQHWHSLYIVPDDEISLDEISTVNTLRSGYIYAQDSELTPLGSPLFPHDKAFVAAGAKDADGVWWTVAAGLTNDWSVSGLRSACFPSGSPNFYFGEIESIDVTVRVT